MSRPRSTARRRFGTTVALLAAWPAMPWAQPAGAAGAAGGVVEVAIKDFRFDPAALTVKAGTTVRWTNLERRTSHSVLFTGPGGFEGERLLPGESWQHRFEQPGRYPYSCGPHPEMKGLLEVTP